MALPTTRTASSREAILDATDVLMARYGFRKMTMEEVARVAGVSKRTIYVYFRNKEDVGLSSIDRVVEKVQNELREIAASALPTSEKLSRVLEQRVISRLNSVVEYRESLDELFEAVRPAYLARRQAYFQQEVEIVAALIQEGMDEGLFKGDPAVLGESMVLATNAFLPYSLSVAEIGAIADVRKRLRALVQLLLQGVEVCPNRIEVKK